MTTDAQPPETTHIQTSTRDLAQLGRQLAEWLATTLPAGSAPRVDRVEAPSSNGMSSETVLFDASWTEDGTSRSEPLVARVAPDPAAVPVFRVYDLPRQARVMTAVAEHSPVPVPRVYWSEPDPSAIGAPFFVMQRVDGIVPPDVMPYNFGSWLSEADGADQARLQTSTIEVLAQLHAIDQPTDTFAFLQSTSPGATALHRHVADQRAFYEWVASDGIRSPLIERCFAWLSDHWPDDEGPTVLSWGDSRIGNVMYRDFRPVAVLDWEMAGLGPAEIDLAWLIYMHRMFEDIATQYGLGGMPDFMRRDDVASTYEALAGAAPRDLDFYTMYAAIRYGVVMLRTQRRAIHFGEAVMPADVDDLMMNRPALEAMLAGTYW